MSGSGALRREPGEGRADEDPRIGGVVPTLDDTVSALLVIGLSVGAMPAGLPVPAHDIHRIGTPGRVRADTAVPAWTTHSRLGRPGGARV